MLEHLPERLKTRKVGEALFSPSATLLAGAGASAAILGGLPLVAAAVVGAAVWAARVAMAVERPPAEDRIDLAKVREPWRSFVADALDARRRFARAVERRQQGPLRERLAALGRQLDEAVDACWRIARQGDVLDDAVGAIDVAAVREQLSRCRKERPSEARDRSERALEAQLGAARRLNSVAQQARDRLRVLNAELDEAVARAVELSVSQTDAAGLDPLAGQVDSLVGELESLRQALEETNTAPAARPAASA